MLRRISIVASFSFLAACGGGHTPTDGGNVDAGGDGSMMGDGGADMTTMPDGGADMTVMPDGGTDMPVVVDMGADLPVIVDMGVDMPVVDMGPMCPVAMDLRSATGDHLVTTAITGGEPTYTPGCGDMFPAQFFVWVAPADGDYTFDTLGSDFDTVMELRMSDCVGTVYDCNDDSPVAPDNTSRLDVTVATGDVVFIAINGFDGETGSLVVNITQPTDETLACHDATDNDRDGRTDCVDDDCVASDPSCTETNCTNAADDDGDGDADCADGDCSALAICVVPNCGNGAVDTADGEGCDDGNGAAGDGCDDFCQVEPFYACSGAPSACTVPPYLVINELDYDQASTDAASFIEIYNPTPVAMSLTTLAVVLVNGGVATPIEYRRFDLSVAGASLASHAYLVIGNATITGALPPGALAITATGDFIQNGGPDAVAIIDTSTSTVLDALSYEGEITAGTITGFAAPVSFVEGTAFPDADTNDDLHSLCRDPNGADSNDAATDWFLTTTITPGADNVATP